MVHRSEFPFPPMFISSAVPEQWQQALLPPAARCVASLGWLAQPRAWTPVESHSCTVPVTLQASNGLQHFRILPGFCCLLLLSPISQTVRIALGVKSRSLCTYLKWKSFVSVTGSTVLFLSCAEEGRLPKNCICIKSSRWLWVAGKDENYPVLDFFILFFESLCFSCQFC